MENPECLGRSILPVQIANQKAGFVSSWLQWKNNWKQFQVKEEVSQNISPTSPFCSTMSFNNIFKESGLIFLDLVYFDQPTLDRYIGQYVNRNATDILVDIF